MRVSGSGGAHTRVPGSGGAHTIKFDVQWFNKTATRLAEVPVVRACVRACVCACVRACVRVCVLRVRSCVCVCVCVYFNLKFLTIESVYFYVRQFL